jgi:hypothetical protein
VQELLAVSRMPVAQRERTWRAQVAALQRTSKFDPSWLVDLHEHMMLEMAGPPFPPPLSLLLLAQTHQCTH